MQDKELENLCKSIYRKYKAAIDLIVQYGATTAFGEAAEEFIRDKSELEQCKVRARSLWLIPKNWMTVMPRVIKDWESPYPVAIWFYLDQRAQKLWITLEIGPLPNAERRRRLVEAFRRTGFTIKSKADREKAKYSRFYSRTRVIEEIGDSNEVRQAMEELWQQSQDEVERTINVIKNFAWNE